VTGGGGGWGRKASWYWVVVPVWNLPVTMSQNLAITWWFTVLAVVRGYLVRRFFNGQLHKAAKAMALAFIRGTA